ncbi:jg5087, partial [Pararge aegeria aegeria]
AHMNEKNQKATCPPTVFSNAPKAVVTKNPKPHDAVMATVDPLLLTLVVNISPIMAFGIMPRPSNKEIKSLLDLELLFRSIL